MTPRGAIAQLAKMVGHDLARGEPSPGAMQTGPMIAEVGATAEVAAGLFAESRRKRPDDRTIAGYAFILESALNTLRISSNGGDTGAAGAIQEVRQAVDRAIARGDVASAALMQVARAFAQAELDPGHALQQAMIGALDAEADTRPTAARPQDAVKHLAEVAKALDHNPFAIHGEIAASGTAFPVGHRAAMAGSLAASDIPAVREAALGFVLDPAAAISAAVLDALIQNGRDRPASSVLVERLVRMRPWLPETRRPGLDAAVRTLRPKAATPIATVRPEIRAVLASMCDGVGAQSLFALVKLGRRFALASVLIKADLGVADAWVRDGMTRAGADDVVEQIATAAEAVDVPIGLVERRLADALATNLRRDTPPPFGLVQVSEALGLGPLHPLAVAPAALVEQLLQGLPPARTDAKAALAAHRASAGWPDRIGTINSWFEAGEQLEALLQTITPRRKRIEAVLTQHLPRRRQFWAERCAWMAATLKVGAEEDDDTWIDFALVARDLAGDTPLPAIPLATFIADVSVAAFGFRGSRGQPPRPTRAVRKAASTRH